LSEADRRRQAAIDAGEFADTLQTKVLDQEGIARLVASGATQAVLEDIVRMVVVQERLFEQFVQTALPAEPELAHELQHRANQLSIRFRMALTAAAMTEVVRQIELPREPESRNPSAG
jgi:hypothetical protein